MKIDIFIFILLMYRQCPQNFTILLDARTHSTHWMLCLCPKYHLMVTDYHHARNTLTFTIILMKIVTTINKKNKLKVIILTVSQNFVSNLLQLLPKLEVVWYWGLWQIIKKNPRRRLGDHGVSPVESALVPDRCGAPSNFTTVKLLYFVFPAKLTRASVSLTCCHD